MAFNLPSWRKSKRNTPADAEAQLAQLRAERAGLPAAFDALEKRRNDALLRDDVAEVAAVEQDVTALHIRHEVLSAQIPELERECANHKADQKNALELDTILRFVDLSRGLPASASAIADRFNDMTAVNVERAKGGLPPIQLPPPLMLDLGVLKATGQATVPEALWAWADQLDQRRAAIAAGRN